MLRSAPQRDCLLAQQVWGKGQVLMEGFWGHSECRYYTNTEMRCTQSIALL